jgi:competence protein ComEA
MRQLFAALVLSLFMAVPALAAINLNTATQAELESVKGIGPGKAKAIIAHREKNGPFKSVDELDKVKGFGKASVNKLRDQFEVKGSAAPK